MHIGCTAGLHSYCPPKQASPSYPLIPTFSPQPRTSTMKSILSILALVACALAAPAAVAQGKYSTYGKLNPPVHPATFFFPLLLHVVISRLIKQR